ncbi:hypothetical protein RCL1_003117 [Eukaryota sp. TZLM3-RCL]
MKIFCIITLIYFAIAHVLVSRPFDPTFLTDVPIGHKPYILSLFHSTFLYLNGYLVDNFFLFHGFHIFSNLEAPQLPRSSMFHQSSCVSFDSRFFLDTSIFPDSQVHFTHLHHFLTDNSKLDTLLVAFQFSSSQSNNEFNQFSFKLFSFISFISSNMFESIVDNEIFTLSIPTVALNQDDYVIANLTVLDVPIYCKGNFDIEVHFVSLSSCSFCMSRTGLIDFSSVRILTATLAPHLFVDSYVLFIKESSSLILFLSNSKLRLHDYDHQKSIEFSSPLSNVKAATHIYSSTSSSQFLLLLCPKSKCQIRILTIKFTTTDLEPDLNVVVLSAGEAHSAAVLADGTVKTWGSGANGRLGHGDFLEKVTPTTVDGIVDAVSVACGDSHTLVLRRNGEVLGFGLNTGGQLGDDTTTSKTSPAATHILTLVVSISAGHVHSLAMKRDGTVWSWGQNENFQLGRFISELNGRIPVQIPDISGARAIVAGFSHSLIVKSDGSVVAFGSASDGRLGNGKTVNDFSIQNCGTFTSAVSVAAGSHHSLILLDNGDLWATGRNDDGQLGTHFPIPQSTPVHVSGFTFAAVTAGGHSNIGVLTNGEVVVWGRNDNYQLGDGTVIRKPTPFTLSSLSNLYTLSMGGTHTLVASRNGTSYGFGHNGNGRVGDGTNQYRLRPTHITALD